VQGESRVPQIVGRYAIFGEIAAGGMATVHYGRLLGPIGFSRTVAIKRLHGHFSRDPEFVSMFLDEARLAARIRHSNVVQTLDVVALDRELLLVMEYVHGESLAECLRAARARGEAIPVDIVSAIVCAVLHGLHAAHEATDEQGVPLGIVHRDVGPQNVLVGADGVPRVLDFGVAKAVGRIQTTRDGQLKGKLAYMAPEQVTDRATVDRRTDVYAAGVVLWETLTRQRLFRGENEALVIRNVLERRVEAPSTIVAGLPQELDAIALRALDRSPDRRFDTARQMALALEQTVPVASSTRVAQWIEAMVPERLAERAHAVAELERGSAAMPADATTPRRRTSTAATAPGSDSAPVEAVGASLSQASSVSLATTRVRTEPTRALRLSVSPGGAAAVIGVALLVAVALAGWTVRRAGPTPEPSGHVESATVPPEPQETPSAAPALSSEPTAAAAPPSATTPPPAPTASATHPGQPAARALPRPCTLRSYIDDTGIKHWVRDCK
jgi:eukaryotic-like serine/threonine-protein kinase